MNTADLVLDPEDHKNFHELEATISGGDLPSSVIYKPQDEELGRKFDDEKPDWSLLDLNILGDMVDVLTFGAHKYDRDNWQHVPDAKNRYYAALMRHLNAYRGGEILDPESGLPHLGHAMCCLTFMSWFEQQDAKD